MPRRRPQKPQTFLWQLIPGDITAIANARICLGLIRVVRRFQGLLERRSADDVGEALAPALAELAKELHAAMHTKRRYLLTRNDAESLDVL